MSHGRKFNKESGVNVMKRWHFFKRLLPLAVLILMLTGCGYENLSALQPKGEVAEKQLSLILLSISIMVLVFVVVMIIFTYVLIRYRSRPGQEDEIPEQVEGSHKLEIIWTVIPIILILVLAVPTVMTAFSLAEKAPEYSEAEIAEGAEPPFVVDVKAYQFWWQFSYPDDGITTAQELVIPVDTKVYINLDSGDVIHSFWVPSLAGKMDNNPGLTNQMYIHAYEPGVYEGRCTEFCGDSHSLMNFRVIVKEQEEYEAWVASMQNFEDTAEGEAIERGREVYANNCLACHAIDSSSPGGVGPNLAGFGDRTMVGGLVYLDREDPQSLRDWIRNAPDFKPGIMMPQFTEEQISDQELEDLIEYLNSLTLE